MMMVGQRCGFGIFSSFIKVSSLSRPSSDPGSYGISIVTSGWMQGNLIKLRVSAHSVNAPQDLEFFKEVHAWPTPLSLSVQ